MFILPTCRHLEEREASMRKEGRKGGMNNPQNLISIQEAARMTGVAVPTLYKWVSQRKIHHIKMGSLVKFDPMKLEEWITQQTVMPMPWK